MAEQRTRPPVDADERTSVLGWLDLQRAIVRWKCENLTDDAAHRAVVPTSPLMTAAGLVAHLRWAEHGWISVLFAGRDPGPNPWFAVDHDDDPDADWRTDAPIAVLLDAYARECATSNAVIAAASLDDTAVHPDADDATLRWVLHHMLEETARHAGHLDLVTELADGRTGYR